MKHRVIVQRATLASAIPPDSAFLEWAAAGLSTCPYPAEMTVRVVGKRESRKLNRQYRGKDRPTNVLSFQAELPDELVRKLAAEGAHAPLGDLVLCAPVIIAEAAEQGKSTLDHWAHMVIHGALHLLGLDHQEAREARRMERREADLLASLGISNPYS